MASCFLQVVTVTLVTETFAFAINESISTVLVPASAFPTNENTSLCDCIARGDCLLVVAHPLMQRSGNVEAEGLDEVIAIGDMVYYEAHHTAKGWRAQRWSMREPAAGSSDSFTQTAMTFEQMLIRAVGPELADFLRQRIPNILAYAAL
uniref:DUF7930 domain-containing protein n=1 Tax=Parascaris equorum TaxID=6256 RepID=A0A914R957_PAREQ